MIDPDEHEDPREDPDEAPIAEYVIRPTLPAGRILYPIDSDRGTVMLVREGHMSPELCTEINQALRCLIDTGAWTKPQRDTES